MIGWFKSLDLAGKAGILFLLLAAVAICIGTAVHLVDALTATAEKKGAVTERAAAQQATLEHVETANAAKARYRSDAAVRDADCLLDATNPQDC
jgi:hypothetical protein